MNQNHLVRTVVVQLHTAFPPGRRSLQQDSGKQVQQELAEVERESSATKAAPQGAMLEYLKLRSVSLLGRHTQFRSEVLQY